MQTNELKGKRKNSDIEEKYKKPNKSNKSATQKPKKEVEKEKNQNTLNTFFSKK
jgi:hypothetical protein